MLDLAEWVYLLVYSMLLSFLNVIKPNETPVLKPGRFDIYDSLKDRSKLTIRQRMRDDRIIIFESLPEFFLFTKVKPDLPVPDELTRGLPSSFINKTVSIRDPDFPRYSPHPTTRCYPRFIGIDS